MFNSIVDCLRKEVPKASITTIIPSGTAIRLMRYHKGDTLNRDGQHLSMTLGRYTRSVCLVRNADRAQHRQQHLSSPNHQR